MSEGTTRCLGLDVHKASQAAAQVVLDDYRVVEQAASERVRRLELALRRCAEQSPQLPLIAALPPRKPLDGGARRGPSSASPMGAGR